METASWRPIVFGRKRSQVLDLTARIARRVEDLASTTKLDASLGTGLSGCTLFLREASLVGLVGERGFAATLERACESAGELIPEISLMDGLTGVAWIVRESSPDGGLADLNESLQEMLITPGTRPAHGLVDGLAGIMYYALGDRDSQFAWVVASECVRRLATQSDAGLGAAWLTPSSQLPDALQGTLVNGAYELGVAHGVAGVARVLGWATAAGVPGARELATRAVNWLLDMRRVPGVATEYPPMIDPEGNPSRRRCRSAWCSGDAAVGYVLFRLGTLLRLSHAQAAGLEIACAASRRRLAESRVVDTTLCHGGAGQCLLMNHLYQATRETVFLEAATRWLDWTLRELDTTSMAAGLMLGLSGCGLALLASATDRSPRWDSVLGLSELSMVAASRR